MGTALWGVHAPPLSLNLSRSPDIMMLRVVTSRPMMWVTPSGKAPRTQSAASGSCHTFASHAGLTLPMTKKAPPK